MVCAEFSMQTARLVTSFLVTTVFLNPFAFGCGKTDPTFDVDAGIDSGPDMDAGGEAFADSADALVTDAPTVGDEDAVSDGPAADGALSDGAVSDGALSDRAVSDSAPDAPADARSDVAVRDGGPEGAIQGDSAALADSTVTDAGGPATDTGVNPCAFDGNVPDVPIGDAGATTVGCTTCIYASCGPQAAACTASCACATQLASLLLCASGGQSALTCLATIPGSVPLTELVLCTSTACAASCGI
jgi:hypothetical protein